VLEGELAAAQKEFETLTGKELPALNSGLTAKKLDPVKVMTRDEWQKKQEKS
jgi:hypothetical protein